MNTSFRSFVSVVVAGLLGLALAGCSPSAKKARYIEQADRYFTDSKYDEAEIDYKNALLIENLNPRAIRQLGLIYYSQGRLGRSFVYVQKATELQKDDLEMRIKLGQLYFAFGQMDEARNQATYVLERRPEDADAILLLADTSRNPKEIEAARVRLKALSPGTNQSAAIILALGIFDLRENKLKEAEAAFQRALALDPKLVEAHTVLGTLYRVTKDARADQELKTASDMSPPRSPRRLQYAQFKVQSGNTSEARTILEAMTKQTPDYLPALIVLSQVSAVEKKYDEAASLLTKVLERDPVQPEAMLLIGRVELARGNNAKAMEYTEKMIRTYPKAAQAHEQLALEYLNANQTDKAIASLNQAMALAPSFSEAAILLATLNNQKGDYSSTIIAMKRVVQQHPEMPRAWLLLADAHRGQGNLNDALGVYAQIEKLYPNAGQTPFFVGQIYVQQKRYKEARTAFNRSLELIPNNVSATEQLIGLDMLENDFPSAIQRAEGLVSRNPKSAQPYLVLARIYSAQKDAAKTEAALKKAIELQPDSPDAYYMLAGLYFTTNQHEKALANLAGLTAKNPKDAQAWMISGVLHDQIKDSAAARADYEKVIAINPQSTPALNNLAYIYAEKYNELDKALEVAQKAHDLAPQEPHSADTLGWILFRKHEYAKALPLLTDSANQIGDSAEVQYHLGMAQYMAGNEDAARTALKRALEIETTFAGSADAKRTLEFLSPGAVNMSRSDLEKIAAERPDDAVALARLATAFEREGKTDKAIATNEAALKINPSNAKAMLSLARLYVAKNDPAKALEFAKAARKAAPVDPDVAYAAGKLAFQTGDYAWAASLIQEAARRSPDDPEIAFDSALASYAIGRVSDTQDALQTALSSSSAFSRTEKAKQMQAWIQLAANPSQDAAATINQELKTDPSNVPALMVLAALDEQKGDVNGAKEAYEKVLARYPDFTPAKRGLAIYYSRNPGDDQKAYDLAVKSRDAYPSDPEVAKALGIISYRRGEFQRAASLLMQAANARPNDADSLFYLGMSQAKLKKNTEAKRSLQKAVDSGLLKADRATEAKKTLAELK